ncbi:hypothetical protein OZX60_04280 [Streptococcaceae bacterium ESL0687]|nr:hypothetical protein OZX60_04280 [Streptococcaceae bacterium ESL0687]
MELTDLEHEDSLAYVCYDRTMFHYLERIQKFSLFKILFMDRYLGFDLLSGNEPIIPLNSNGFDRLKKEFEEEITCSEITLENTLKNKFREGCTAYAMLANNHKDGSIYFTSTLIEDIKGNQVFLTKTNETNRNLKVPFTLEDFKLKFGPEELKDFNLVFLNASKINLFLERITWANIFEKIMFGKYAYTCKNGNLYQNGQIVEPSRLALDGLYEYYRDRRSKIFDEGLAKSDQLRMYKHIANKIEPILNCWEEVFSFYGAEIESTKQINHVRNDLKELFKWFSFLNARQSPSIYDKYLVSLKNLGNSYALLQKSIHAFVLKEGEKNG